MKPPQADMVVYTKFAAFDLRELKVNRVVLLPPGAFHNEWG
jgi:hypothetical protein